MDFVNIAKVLLILLFIFLSTSAISDDFSVVAVGDLTVGTQLKPVIEKKGPDVFFAEIGKTLKEADLVLGFLNCAISDVGEKKQDVKMSLRAPPGLARGLASSGFDVLSLATPHSSDYGPKALKETIRLLKWYGIKPIGAASDLTSARKPVILTIQESKIAFLAYYQGGLFSGVYANDLPPKGNPGLAPADYHLMKDDVAKASQRAELVIVLLHWGEQDSDKVTKRQKYFTHGLIDSGADLVFCQRLHTFQGIELYKSRPIVYSMADFVFERYDKRYSRVVVPEIIFRNDRVSRIKLIPIQTDTGVNYQPKLLHGDEASSTLKIYQSLCAELDTDLKIENGKGSIEITDSTY